MTHEDIVHWLYEEMQFLDGFVGACKPKWRKEIRKEIDYCFYLICLLTENEV